MNYEKIYYDLVLNAKLYPKINNYYENHHILPRSLGGCDSPTNIVRFTGRQHYIAHWLLYKIYKTWNMAEAWRMMTVISPDHNNRYTSYTFELARLTANMYRIGQKRTDETKMKIGLKSKGRKHSDETIKKIRDKLKNRIMSPQHIDNIKKANLKYPEKQLTIYDETHRSCKKVYQYDLDNNFIKEYPSGRAAGIETGCSINGISACCNNKQIQSGGFIWSFNYPL